MTRTVRQAARMNISEPSWLSDHLDKRPRSPFKGRASNERRAALLGGPSIVGRGPVRDRIARRKRGAGVAGYAARTSAEARTQAARADDRGVRQRGARIGWLVLRS